MKLKIITLLIFIFCFSFGQKSIKNTNTLIDTTTNNIVADELEVLKSDIEKLSKTISVLDSLSKTKTSRSLTDKKFKEIDKSLSNINEELNSQINSINFSLEQIKDELTNNINTLSDSLLTTIEAIRKLDPKIEELFVLNHKADSLIVTLNSFRKEDKSQMQLMDKTITDRTLYWIIAILIVLIIVISIFFFLKKQVVKQQGTLSSVKEAQDKLEKESLKLDEKRLDLIENQLSVMKLQPQSSKAVDHSFTKVVANDIQRIRNRLKHMSQDEQATKVIRKRVESLEDAIKENGYELIQLEGRPYKEGMTIQAQFVPDETLKKGDRIISRVIKPQINFDGKLIQVAEVQVSQGT